MTFEEMLRAIRDAKAQYIYTRRKDFGESFATTGKRLKISKQACHQVLENYFQDIQRENKEK